MAVTYKHLALGVAASNTQIDTGAGIFTSIILSDDMASTAPLYFRDGTDATGAIILQLPPTLILTLKPYVVEIGANYTTGLFAQWGGGPSGAGKANITVIYDT